MKSKSVLGALLVAGMACAPAAANDLVYTPIDPSFGGSPLNSSHLLGLANAQRDATAKDAKKSSGSGGGTGGGGTGNSQSDVDLFIQQLQGRLLSALASQVTDAIFGDNPQDHGTIQFGDTTVEFDRTLDSISLTITAGDGTVTTIVVPQLVTNTGGATAKMMAPTNLQKSALSAGGDLVTNVNVTDSLAGKAPIQ
jgi:curli production assembly/transport component CsgF